MKETKLANPLHYFSQHHALGALLNKVKMLNHLQGQIVKYLPTNVQSYCKVIRMHNNHLTLLAANASIATQIRLEASHILAKFHQDAGLKHICSIHCKVSPSLAPTLRPKKRMAAAALLTEQTASVIKEIAETITDPKLKAVMLKIAEHTKV